MGFEEQKGMVDAIEDGRIVRVTEEYARREGLMVIRRPEPSALDSPKAQQQMKMAPRLRGERKAYFDIDKYRRPWHDKNEILSSLQGNFNWLVASRRKQLNLSRKQLAVAINASEEDLKMIENGILPQSDYVLISKLEEYLKVNLRKNKMDSGSEKAQEFVSKGGAMHKPKWMDRMNRSKPGTGAEELVGDIEIIDDSDEDLKKGL